MLAPPAPAAAAAAVQMSGCVDDEDGLENNPVWKALQASGSLWQKVLADRYVIVLPDAWSLPAPNFPALAAGFLEAHLLQTIDPGSDEQQRFRSLLGAQWRLADGELLEEAPPAVANHQAARRVRIRFEETWYVPLKENVGLRVLRVEEPLLGAGSPPGGPTRPMSPLLAGGTAYEVISVAESEALLLGEGASAHGRRVNQLVLAKLLQSEEGPVHRWAQRFRLLEGAGTDQRQMVQAGLQDLVEELTAQLVCANEDYKRRSSGAVLARLRQAVGSLIAREVHAVLWREFARVYQKRCEELRVQLLAAGLCGLEEFGLRAEVAVRVSREALEPAVAQLASLSDRTGAGEQLLALARVERGLVQAVEGARAVTAEDLLPLAAYALVQAQPDSAQLAALLPLMTAAAPALFAPPASLHTSPLGATLALFEAAIDFLCRDRRLSIPLPHGISSSTSSSSSTTTTTSFPAIPAASAAFPNTVAAPQPRRSGAPRDVLTLDAPPADALGPLLTQSATSSRELYKKK